jgi:alpha-L-arabinofuranosidase
MQSLNGSSKMQPGMIRTTAKGPRIFAGEYAAQSVATVSPENKNNWLCALSEAAFMTGLERNADIVNLCSYAPLFAHAEGWQWTPDLIWFDNLSAYATPNYYVQQLYSNYKGTDLLLITSDNSPITGQDGLYASCVWDKLAKEVIIKIVNSAEKKQAANISLSGNKKYLTDAEVISIAQSDGDAVNTFDQPENIKPMKSGVSVKGKKITLNLESRSLTVVRVRTR